ncbi:MAG: D-inositol-3-phosphate glycosyltransferase [Frankiales bacterium]|jgi:glycosyltransferase involved in cell wall biosynthesis|nr:D-inositol-3-phosphate glycosyltransferase [Frankiales bacterium]
MRILMVTPYAPLRDGIAAYALQQVGALRAEGHDVEVLSPGPSAAHHHLDFSGLRGIGALAKRVRAYDKVIVQFHPDLFYPHPTTPDRHAAVSAALLAVAKASRNLEIVVHEIDYRLGQRKGLDSLAAKAFWRQVTTIMLHTDAEREDFISSFGVKPDRIKVIAHGASFVKRTRADRATARRTLGIDPGAFVFLAIGFIQPHKGFDRAVRAFTGLAEHGCELHVVGSVRVDDPEFASYLGELEALVENTPGTSLHTGFVSDELFDRWIVAADVVVLPYRNIWSSSVLERAMLYGQRVLVTSVGALANQVGDRPLVTLVDGDAGLMVGMRQLLGRGDDIQVESSPWLLEDGDEPLRERIQDELVARAQLRRGGRAAVGEHGGLRDRSAAASATRRSAALRRLPPLAPPAAVSARRGASTFKRLVRRATAWEVDPVIHQVNALRDAVVQAIEEPNPRR